MADLGNAKKRKNHLEVVDDEQADGDASDSDSDEDELQAEDEIDVEDARGLRETNRFSLRTRFQRQQDELLEVNMRQATSASDIQQMRNNGKKAVDT